MAIVTCPNCGAKNRVDDERAERLRPVCGKCGQRLPASTAGDAAASGAGGRKPIEVSDATLADTLARAGATPVLVDCWAAWCGPCRLIAPVIDELAAEAGGRYVVTKLDIDRNQRTAQAFAVDSIPTLLIFKNGQLLDRMVGLQPKGHIARKLAHHAS